MAFLGFGIFGSYYDSDLVYNVKWFINDVESEWFRLEPEDKNKDPETKWMEIRLKEHFDLQPIDLKAGDSFVLAMRLISSDTYTYHMELEKD